MIPDGEEGVDKDSCIHDIRYRFAFHLFTQHRFEESLKIFTELNTGERSMLPLSIAAHVLILGTRIS